MSKCTNYPVCIQHKCMCDRLVEKGSIIRPQDLSLSNLSGSARKPEYSVYDDKEIMCIFGSRTIYGT